jgi:hypothetical protein
MSKEKIVTTDFVFRGNDYKSNQRALKKESQLIANGYKLVRENSKRKTFTKTI